MPSDPLVVVSNRGPYRAEGSGAKRRLVRAAGGLVTALDPVLRESGGTWVSAQETDHPLVDEHQEEADGFALAPVQIERRVREAFYGPVSNGVLWPTLHSLPSTVSLGTAPWHAYVAANEAFARGALGAGGPSSIYWIHDYQLMLVPGRIRDRAPDARVGWFCHVPWPGPDLLGALPWREEILEGLLGADLVGFHTATYARQFLECVARLTTHEVDPDKMVVRLPGRTLRVSVAPIGVPVDDIEELANDEKTLAGARRLKWMLQDRKMVLGVDRLDYTKGVPERLRAFDRLLRRYPRLRSKVVLVQVMVPSREAVAAYRDLKDEVDRMVGDINGRFATTGRIPVQYFYRSFSKEDLYAHYRAADVALVTPLRDGMNLVAMEYCASHVDGDGALVLSEFAGAADYLDGALTVNPHDMVGTTEALIRALKMGTAERRRRMGTLRERVRSLDVHGWAARFLAELTAATGGAVETAGRIEA